MQPLPGAGTETKGMVLSIRGTGKTQQSINSEQFWTKNLEDVAPDEVFFHKYFNQRATRTKDQKDDKKEEESEDEEEEIWSAMVGSRLELEADSGDVDMDDEEMGGLDLGNISDSEGEEGSDEEGEGESEGEGETEGVEGEGIYLDAAIAASQRKPEDDYDDGDAVLGLDEEGSNVWASDDVEVPSDIDMGLDSAFAVELETNNSAAKVPAPKKSNKKRGKKAEEKVVGELGKGDGGVKKKRKLKHMPTFALADDYAHLLSD